MSIVPRRAALVLYRAGADIAGKVAMFAVTVVAARRLSQQAFGVFSLASVFGAFVGLASDFGIPIHVARAVAQRPAQAPEILRRWLQVRLGTSSVITVLVILGVLTSSSRGYAIPILMFALTYVLSALIDFLNYFYRGMGRSDIESTISIWQRGTMVGAGLLALWWSTNLNVLAAATLAPVAVTFVFSVWFSRRLARRTADGRQADTLTPLVPLGLEFWRDVFPIGAGMMFSALYFRIDVFLVEHWRGPESVAIYNAAFRMLEGVRLLPGAVMAVMLPSLCQATDAGPLRRVALGLTLFGCVVGGLSWAAAGWMLPLVFGGTYAGAAHAFRILMVSFPLMSLNYVLTQQLIGWHGQRTYAVVCGAALVLNVASNLWLIPSMGIEGAAWATVATEVVVTLGCAWGLRDRLLNLPPSDTAVSLAAG